MSQSPRDPNLRMRPPLGPVLALACAGLLGCTGMIDGSQGGRGGPAAPGGPMGPEVVNPPPPPPEPPKPGELSDRDSVPAPAPLRRLTRTEYDNTLRDLLGLSTQASTTVGLGEDVESHAAGFLRGGVLTGGDDVRKLMTGTSTLVDSLQGKLASLLPCNPVPAAAPEQEACAKKFIEQFGKRAYRRPLTAREAEVAFKLYTTQRGPEVGASFEAAMADLVAAFLQAPQFLYHWELGSGTPQRDGALVRYNDYEIASRLSYMFWASMPDDQLFAAADAKQLSSPDQIAMQARRLLEDPRAKDGLADFFQQFLELGPFTQTPKDESIKDFSPAVAQSMLNETRAFVAGFMHGGKASGSLAGILTSTDTVIDGSLAKIYGITSVTGAEAKPVGLDPAKRAGIFTQLAFLTARADTSESHPVKRGETLLRRLLCTELVVPSALMIPPVGDPVPGGATTRQRFEMHVAPACVSCHSVLDPLGFAFEGYDAIGAFRATDQGKPVDSTGSVVLPESGKKLTFKDAVDLVGQLANEKEVQDCMSAQWMRYMLRRRDVPQEASSLAVARDLFRKSNFDLRELLVGLTRTRSFTHRSPSAGEVLQ